MFHFSFQFYHGMLLRHMNLSESFGILQFGVLCARCTGRLLGRLNPATPKPEVPLAPSTVSILVPLFGLTNFACRIL